jgi:hypothetical protein
MLNFSTARETYIPTDHVQEKGWSTWGDAIDQHEKDYQSYGPPPRGYIVIRAFSQRAGVKGQYPSYKPSSNAPRSWPHHPFSDHARQSRAPVITQEFRDDREVCAGFFQPPFEYVPDQWSWNYTRTWNGAIAGALTAVNAKDEQARNWSHVNIHHTHKSLIEDRTKFGTPEDYVLWHPGDRNTAVFMDEPACSIVARHLGYSLIIVCPQVRADGIGWNRIYNTHNRPPIYTRWSTGIQANNPPLVLGCIPRQTYVGKSRQETMWFFMKPKNTNVGKWMRGPLDQLAPVQFRFPEAQNRYFFWALVSLHRRIVVGGIAIPDDHLGCWLHHFGQYLEAHKTAAPSTRPPFVYDQSKRSGYGGKNFTFLQLTAWILNPNFKGKDNSVARHTAKWDRAVEARIQYQLNKTDANWDEWVKNFADVVQSPTGL